MTNDRKIDVSIVIPTFRESANLPTLLSRIESTLEKSQLRGEVLIVDDNSRDGTIEFCHNRNHQVPVKLFVRTEERGLSSAVIAGLDRAAGEMLLVMDADLSHPPESIPAMLDALEQDGTQMVIGSRYVDGGSTTDDWGFLRWLNSIVATIAARPLTNAKDPMSGFFAIRHRDYHAARSRLNPIGYKIGLELLVKCGCKNVAEVPITFANRVAGESKLTVREQINYVRHIFRLMRFSFLTGVPTAPSATVPMVTATTTRKAA